jgi:multisubunit Na+/H+ antiporter MnhC subunit
MSRNMLIAAGALLILLGAAGLTVPVFQTHQLTDVAKIGTLKVQADENTSHVVPQALSITALVVGLGLVVVGIGRRAA